MSSGWKNESQRHAMASKGIKTGNLTQKKVVKSKVKELPSVKDTWSHQDVLLMMKRVNTGVNFDPVTYDYIREHGVELDKANIQKGREWLLKNKSSMGYNEIMAVEKLDTIKFTGFVEAVDMTGDARYNGNSGEYPIYTVYGDGRSFDYAVFGGKLYLI